MPQTHLKPQLIALLSLWLQWQLKTNSFAVFPNNLSVYASYEELPSPINKANMVYNNKKMLIFSLRLNPMPERAIHTPPF